MTTYIPSLTLPDAFFAKPAIALLLPNILGIAISYAVMSTSSTYKKLKQPPLAPPGWVFGPVWTILYGLMGYAAYHTFKTGISSTTLPSTHALTRQGCTLYTIQLLLNNIWTPLFFHFRAPILASIDILALLVSITYLIYIWGRVDIVATWTLAPYWLWVAFASYVCIGTAVVNGWDLSTREGEKNE